MLENSDSKYIKAEAVGEQYMEEMVLIKNGEIVERVSGNNYQVRLEYMDNSPVRKEDFYYVRALQMDGQLAWSSPIWVTKQ